LGISYVDFVIQILKKDSQVSERSGGPSTEGLSWNIAIAESEYMAITEVTKEVL
jgi:hypothetical protein